MLYKRVRPVHAILKVFGNASAWPRYKYGFRSIPSSARYESKVYWNTGEHGAKENHWLRLRFSGVKDAELIGARVELTAAGKKQYRWIHSNHSYKSGGALEAHFGLGKQSKVDVKVALPNGKTATFAGVKADQSLDLNPTTGKWAPQTR